MTANEGTRGIFSTPGRRRFLVCALLFLALGAACLAVPALLRWKNQHRRFDRREDLLHKVSLALQREDADVLCSLASREERKRLNLTPRAVGAILQHGVWQHGGVRTWVIRRMKNLGGPGPLPLSFPNYAFGVRDGAGKRDSVMVGVDRIPAEGWRLRLSSLLLYDNCHHAIPPGKGYPTYRQLAQQYGIRGVMTSPGVYYSLSPFPLRFEYDRTDYFVKGGWSWDCGVDCGEHWPFVPSTYPLRGGARRK